MNPTMMRSTVSRQGSAFVLLAVLFFAVVVAALADPDVAGRVSHERHVVLETGVILSYFGLSGYMLVLSAAVAFVALVVERRAERPLLALQARILKSRAILFFVAVATSGIVCQVIKHALGRARPRFLSQVGAYHFVGPSFRSGTDGFPSGHTTTVFAAALVFSLFKPSWKAGFFAVAGVIGVARILAGAHYPSDVFAGAVLGTAVASSVYRSFKSRGLLCDRGRTRVSARDERPNSGLTSVAS